ncbi:MAG: hypothetical protein VW810_00190 [Pelagibacteraceae bacterium]
MRFTVLTLLLTILIPTISATETTNNLVSQDFTSGWTNTTNTYHGSGTIAGHHNGTVTSDSVSLADDVGLNKNEINQGFTVNSSASVWFWNNYSQSVTMTTQAIDDNGQTITQNRTLSGTCATWNGCDFGSMTDTMVFNSNTQADYDLSLGFSFSVTDPTYQSGHYAADLKDPSMTVTYTPINLDSTTETALLDLNNDIKDDLKDVNSIKIIETTNTGLVDKKEETLDLDTKEELSNDQDATFKESSEPSGSNDNELSDSEPAPQEQETTADDSLQDTENKDQASESNDTKEESSESETSQNATDKENKSSDEKKAVSLAKTMDKIDAKVKDIGKNLELKNLVKLKAMVDNSALLMYSNVPFYKERKIYENQINIFDNRVIYNKTLASYMQKDPIFQKENELFNIRLEKEKLIREIQVLKNAG